MANRVAHLEWLGRQLLPMWGGHLERGEPISDAVMRQEVEDGLIAAVQEPRPGYVLTEKGRHYVRNFYRHRSAPLTANKH